MLVGPRLGRREAERPGRLEAEPRVVVGVAEEHDRRPAGGRGDGRGRPDQLSADALALPLRRDRDRSERQDLTDRRPAVVDEVADRRHALPDDPAGVVEIRELLRGLAHDNGVTIFMSSHNLTEVDRLATRIGILHKGKLIEELTTNQLERLRSQRLEVKTRDLEAACVSLRSAGYELEVKDETILIESAHAIEHPEDIARILVNAGNPPIRLAVEQQNLEDHFLQLTSKTSKQTGRAAPEENSG